jgi:hypothetical protein
MKTDKNDILIREFMQQNKKEIADYHFTDKVMQKIPARRQYDWILILATLLAAIVTLIVGKDFSISSIVICFTRVAQHVLSDWCCLCISSDFRPVLLALQERKNQRVLN